MAGAFSALCWWALASGVKEVTQSKLLKRQMPSQDRTLQKSSAAILYRGIGGEECGAH